MLDLPINNRQSLYHRLLPSSTSRSQTVKTIPTLSHKASNATSVNMNVTSRPQSPLPREREQSQTSQASTSAGVNRSPMPRRVSYANTVAPQSGYLPVLESVDHAVKHTAQNIALPEPMTTDEFTRAVAVATVSALRHQQTHAHSPARLRTSGGHVEHDHGGEGGHDAPSWSRTTSASVLLACTALYAIIAGTRNCHNEWDKY